MEKETWLNQGTEKLTAEDLTKMVGDSDIKVLGFWTHTKATESYVLISICDNGKWREWYIPYVYRRTNTLIDTVQDIAKYIKLRKWFLSKSRVESFKVVMNKQLNSLFGKQSLVTLPIFKKLLENCGAWVWNKEFVSSNPQRRIQDLKEMGFTLATKMENKKTYHMLLPFDIVKAPTYETIPAKVRRAIFAALDNIDAYNDKLVGRSALPDHKFPEIRWTADTAESNEGLSKVEMREKFQLVPESVNQAKREVCRKCFQTGSRGVFSGISFFYKGNDKWPSGIPARGKDAEKGCVGCFWYDMAAWRKALNKLIKDKTDDSR